MFLFYINKRETYNYSSSAVEYARIVYVCVKKER